MVRYAIQRLLVAIPTLLVISVIVFWATRQIASPEGQLTLNPRVSAEDKQRFIEDLGLDRSDAAQYFTWLGNFARGELGTTLATNRQVWDDVLKDPFVNTLVLVVYAVTFSLLIGISIGIISAVKQNSPIDFATTGLAFVGISIPVFVVGLLLQLLFGVWLADWLGVARPMLPIFGLNDPGTEGFYFWGRWRHLMLPAMALAVQLVAVYSRYMRASMLEVLNSDYIRTARSKGLRESDVLTKHAARTALIPLTTQAAIDIGVLVGGLIVTEVIFQYPGMGRVFIDAIQTGDYQVILPWVMITATAVILLNLAADLLYGWLDPRIRYA